jgi:ribosome-interacting GTPase 1
VGAVGGFAEQHEAGVADEVEQGVVVVALVGNPNCGKTALFNRLTGSRQKVANYAGVTIERKEGQFTPASGKTVRCSTCPAPTA